jgi:DNA-directed RNA polymerase beta' subunit
MKAEIKSIKFGIMGDQDILARSVCEINKPTLNIELGSVYDPRLGVCTPGELCETCKKDIWVCTGHFGHISLNVPIIIFYKQVAAMLKIFCCKCSRLLITDKEIEMLGLKGYDKIAAHITNFITTCKIENCGEIQPKIKYDLKDNVITFVSKNKTSQLATLMQPEKIKMIFDRIPDSDVALLGVDTKLFHPKNLVLTKFPVIPVNCRPRVIAPDSISDDDLTIILVDIIKNNLLLFKNTVNEKARAILKFKTLTYCDNSKNIAVHTTNHRPITGLKERITKKNGHVRQNLMGKRCDRTARTVVGGDPTLKLGQVGVPYEIANIITIPEYVTPLNIAELTSLVNTPNKTSVIIKPTGVKLSVSRSRIKPGTVLNHGDKIIRDGATIIVTDCKIPIQQNDIIMRNDKRIPTILPVIRPITLEIGDKVERFLKNGDWLLLNRQPTLHKNSMQGMEVVLLPGKTFRVNLAITPGFNVDFDGDEFNAFFFQFPESVAELKFISAAKYNILSAQSNKPEIFIVQDSLLGAYLMTKTVTEIGRKNFQNCLMRISHNYDYESRLRQIRYMRKEADNVFTSHALYGFLFPPDFHYSTKVKEQGVQIEYGILMSGFLDKTTLKGTKKSLIRVLCMEYDENIASTFVDNIQFLTNAFLEIYPFSIGIKDCLINSQENSDEIKTQTKKYFAEATMVCTSTDIPYIRENRVNIELNKAKDLGLSIAKKSLLPDNNFIDTVTSGSKGDYFNIAQITGLLGQQNINSKRPAPTLTNRTRTLIHYPEVIQEDEMKYRSRGFISSSFIEGMQPDEMFFHAMSGREGMTKTAMGTATTGYIQRSITKIFEDLTIAYDNTVRDSSNNMYQYAYGGHGFDPSKIDIDDLTDEVSPVNFERLANKLNKGVLDEKMENEEIPTFLDIEEIDEIIESCKLQSTSALNFAFNRINNKLYDNLSSKLKQIRLLPSKIPAFKDYVIKKIHAARATPGDAVGIICAQSIGEKQTQSTLDTFHTAGKLVINSGNRLEEILNMNKKLKVKTCSVYFRQKYETANELRQAIGCSLTSVYFKNIYTHLMIERASEGADNLEWLITYTLNLPVLFQNRLNPSKICQILKKKISHIIRDCVFTPSTITLFLASTYVNTLEGYANMAEGHVGGHSSRSRDPHSVITTSIKTELNSLLLVGIQGIYKTHLQYDNELEEWYIVTEGSNLKKLLIHPLVDPKRVYCNDLWEVFDVLGLIGLRKLLINDLKKIVDGVTSIHIRLLVDKMTSKGKPLSITRYTMRNNDVGPLSKSTFEEAMDILINAAIRTEEDKMKGVSAAIIAGNRAPVGTGCFGLHIDYKKIITTFGATKREAFALEEINEVETTEILSSSDTAGPTTEPPKATETEPSTSCGSKEEQTTESELALYTPSTSWF